MTDNHKKLYNLNNVGQNQDSGNGNETNKNSLEIPTKFKYLH